ncbi:GNAT family N-acetyltransferase [Parasphingopyxis sp.]|uniref:GNAT family N-acetyltransferase n=1 Tax=Parasphingopyxis sp. TaxID=1920299 RepID=UPI002611C585|nr:GNAT family N-acetyltransferase [Parasphingopyxis sp.]
MTETLRIERHDGDAVWPAVEALGKAVYTPEMLAHSEFHDVDWSDAEHWVLGYLGDDLVASAGIHRRAVHVDGKPANIAGIGGVKTHPDHQKSGHASHILEVTCTLIDGQMAPDFTLIFVETHNRAFYEKRGWRVFAGTVMVDQHGKRIAFPDGSAMVRDGAQPAPRSGTIDLMGKPW